MYTKAFSRRLTTSFTINDQTFDFVYAIISGPNSVTVL